MIWWLGQPSRARSEAAAIAELSEQSAWLQEVTWKNESEFTLVVEFVIRHLDESFPLKLVYPSFFPATAPRVLPRESIRLSNHQWGEGGELCLQIRADNWDPSFTGAMMVTSAYHLLSGERPAAEERAEVPSAHRISQAQSVRTETWRYLLSEGADAALQKINPGDAVELVLAEHSHGGHWLIEPVRIGTEGLPLWETLAGVPDALPRRGYVVRLTQALPSGIDQERLVGLLEALELDGVLDAMNAAKGEFYVLLVGKKLSKLVLSSSYGDRRTVASYTRVDIPAREQRLTSRYDGLAAKWVAIVGCGSMGSKVAASLARSGVGGFVLVDEQILNPDNLVRNDLDGLAVGMHKVDGLAARIKAINPAAKIDKRRIPLGGQESAASTDAALKMLARCDVIIEATADAAVFNLCAFVARTERKPMVWGEILAGGIGGLIARSRPDQDPPPHEARRQLNNWCDAQGVSWERGRARRYDLELEDAPPLIADDAEVSIVAGHVSRLALDIVLSADQSAFGSSAYAIGLAKEWIFAGPFDVAPIDFSPEGDWGPTKDEDAAEQLSALVSELFPDIVEAASGS